MIFPQQGLVIADNVTEIGLPTIRSFIWLTKGEEEKKLFTAENILPSNFATFSIWSDCVAKSEKDLFT